MAKWSMDIEKLVGKREADIKKVRKAYAFALYSSIVQKTPVGHPDFDKDSGRARGNWNVSVGQPDPTVTMQKTPKYQSPKALPDPNGDEPIYISNNLPYITTLEYGGYPNPPKKGSHTRKGIKPPRTEIFSKNGFSRQAPEGMVGVTIANKDNIFEAVVRGIVK